MPTQRYFSDDGRDQVMLEDDSGRIRLVGDLLETVNLVTGCVIAVMGTENANGEFEVVDIKFPDLPPQPERWALSEPPSSGPARRPGEAADAGSRAKVAIVSGL